MKNGVAYLSIIGGILLICGNQISYSQAPARASRIAAKNAVRNAVDQKLIPMDFELDGVKSPYTPYVIKLIKNLPAIPVKKSLDLSASSNPVQLECFETPGNRDYIGVKQTMIVQASLNKVEAVLDDFNHYKDLFPDFEDVHVVSQDRNQVLIAWEQRIPVFFLPNIKYQSLYVFEKPSPNRKIYRYQLKEAGKIKMSDGLIVIDSIPMQEKGV